MLGFNNRKKQPLRTLPEEEKGPGGTTGKQFVEKGEVHILDISTNLQHKQQHPRVTQFAVLVTQDSDRIRGVLVLPSIGP